jgi:hypothetical protein
MDAKKEPHSPRDQSAQGTDETPIGRMYLSSISESTSYALPDDVKTTVRKWMRAKNQVNMDGGKYEAYINFQELCDNLGLSNTVYPKHFLDLCIKKVRRFISSEGPKLLKNGQFSYHPDGTREWAGYTDAWLQSDWNGDTTNPELRGLSIQKPQNASKSKKENLFQLLHSSFVKWEGKDIAWVLRSILNIAIQKIEGEDIALVLKLVFDAAVERLDDGRTKLDLLRWLEFGDLPNQDDADSGSRADRLPVSVGMASPTEDPRRESRRSVNQGNTDTGSYAGRFPSNVRMGDPAEDPRRESRRPLDQDNTDAGFHAGRFHSEDPWRSLGHENPYYPGRPVEDPLSHAEDPWRKSRSSLKRDNTDAGFDASQFRSEDLQHGFSRADSQYLGRPIEDSRGRAENPQRTSRDLPDQDNTNAGSPVSRFRSADLRRSLGRSVEDSLDRPKGPQRNSRGSDHGNTDAGSQVSRFCSADLRRGRSVADS